MPDMRFAPPSALRFESNEGLNSSRIRTHNERLILSLLRQKGSLSRLEIGQMTALSAQTVTVILRALEDDQLCVAGKTRRGSVGPPATPRSLNPDGAFSFGFHIGRRGARAVLVDFLGHIRDQCVITYSAPDSKQLLKWVVECHSNMQLQLEDALRLRIAGLGVVFSHDFDPLSSTLKQSSTESSHSAELERELHALTGVEVFVQNDVTAAASAEVLFGDAEEPDNLAYVFVGRLVELRLALNHRIHAGVATNLVPQALGLAELEAKLASDGFSTNFLWDPTEEWPSYANDTQWVDTLADQLANLLSMASGFTGVRSLIIEGDISPGILDAITDQTSEKLLSLDGETWTARVGTIGRFAKAVGAASLPLYSRFMHEDIQLSGVVDR